MGGWLNGNTGGEWICHTRWPQPITSIAERGKSLCFFFFPLCDWCRLWLVWQPFRTRKHATCFPRSSFKFSVSLFLCTKVKQHLFTLLFYSPLSTLHGFSLRLLILAIKMHWYFSANTPHPSFSLSASLLYTASFSFSPQNPFPPCKDSFSFQHSLFLSGPCLVLWRLSSLIGVALRLLSTPTPILISPYPLATSLSSASLAEKDRLQTDCLPPVYIKLPHVGLCVFMWFVLCVPWASSFFIPVQCVPVVMCPFSIAEQPYSPRTSGCRLLHRKRGSASPCNLFTISKQPPFAETLYSFNTKVALSRALHCFAAELKTGANG